MTKQTLAWALDKLALRRRVVIASVVETSGSVPGKVGARLAVAESSDGFHGTIGGAGLELKVLNRCMEILENHFEPFGEVQTFGLNKSAKGYEVQPLDSLCGGRVTVSIELIIPPPHVLMMGGGHCANSLAKTINSLNWHHSVTDSRQEYCNAEVFPEASELIHSSVRDFLNKENHDSINRFSDILLLGHDWSEDQQRLLGLLKLCQNNNSKLDGKIFPRIGVIGSRSKWQSFCKAAIKDGINSQLLEEVICPIGINIGAESPEEIAIAVTAQILSLSKGVTVSDKNWRESL
ncbi:MAG: XdhC family protein [Candidatus Thermoplasmatota archaeon]|nr:XdhC family protein [Candidatus Thermoplasmatota archaeon]